MNKVKDSFQRVMMLMAFSPIFLLASEQAARDKVLEIGQMIVNILIAAAGIYFTIMFITRGMKIAQGEMSARELIPPIAGGVVCFLAYFIADMIVGNMTATFK